MEEEKKVEDKKEVQELDPIKLAKIELGKDYKATITTCLIDEKDKNRRINFQFSVHVPSVKEELQVNVREQEIIGSNLNNMLVLTAVRMIAVLDIVVDGITMIDDEGKAIVIDLSFWQMIQQMKAVGRAYKEIVIPLYTKFMEFQQSIETDFDSLKKALAQLGKK